MRLFGKSQKWEKEPKLINWLDWMQIRDMMAHGYNYEAVLLTFQKAYDMTEKEVIALGPNKMDELMHKLKMKQQKSET